MILKVVAVAAFIFLDLFGISYSQVCLPGQYLCYDQKTCFHSSQRCDNVRDCPEGEDEVNCFETPTVTCSTNEFLCGDGTCIPLDRYCDGNPDCLDYSDEPVSGCYPSLSTEQITQSSDSSSTAPSTTESTTISSSTTPPSSTVSSQPTISLECTESQFRCDENCVENTLRCNGVPDCFDLADEVNCPGSSLSIEPRTQSSVSSSTAPSATESIITSSSTAPPSSTVSSQPTTSPEYSRLMVHLYKPFSLSSKSSSEFQKIPTELSSAIDMIFKTPDSAKSSVVNIRSTKNESASKVSVDLEFA